MPGKSLDKPGRENWVSDGSVTRCSSCSAGFGISSAATFGMFGMRRKHHCRICGNIFCWSCCSKRISYTPLTRRDEVGYTEKAKRVCDHCLAGARTAQEEAAKAEAAVLESHLSSRSSADSSSAQEKLASLHDQVYSDFDHALREAVMLQVLYEQQEVDWKSSMRQEATSTQLRGLGAGE